jgi:hypothetical protein
VLEPPGIFDQDDADADADVGRALRRVVATFGDDRGGSLFRPGSDRQRQVATGALP